MFYTQNALFFFFIFSLKHIDRDNYNLIISLDFLQLVFYTQNALLYFLSLTNFSFKMHFYYRVDGLKMRRQTEYGVFTQEPMSNKWLFIALILPVFDKYLNCYFCQVDGRFIIYLNISSVGNKTLHCTTR